MAARTIIDLQLTAAERAAADHDNEDAQEEAVGGVISD
jgi:hypothetical protein